MEAVLSVLVQRKVLAREMSVPIRLDYQNKVAARREVAGLFGSMLGANGTQLLQLLASEVGGTYTPGKLFEGEHVDTRAGRWPLAFDYIVPAKSVCTRVRCKYKSPDGFRLSGSRNDLIHRWLRFPRLPVLQTGVPLIDDSLLIQGTDAARLRAVFAHRHLLACLSALPPAWVEFAIRVERGRLRSAPIVCQLQVIVHTQVKHEGHLRQLLQFSAVLLDQLSSVGSAQPFVHMPAAVEPPGPAAS